MESILGLGSLITLVFILVLGMIAVMFTVVPIALIGFVVYKAMTDQRAVIVLPGGAASMLGATPQPDQPAWIKRAVCQACGASKVQRTLSAYVYCDFCGLLMDWDFQAALADPRSKQPGPTYEALFRQLQPALAQAKQADDTRAYEALQVRLYTAYVQACPAALPPRIKDPAFAERFIAWTARVQTMQDLHPSTSTTFAAQQAAVKALVWDRSQRMPQVRMHTFWPMMDAVVAHQTAVIALLESNQMLEKHPDQPSAAIFKQLGMSAMVQGWMPYLSESETERLLEMTGLSGDYVEVKPQPLQRGDCPHCSAPIDAVEGATRVLCHSCGMMVGMGCGTLPCHGCGSPVEIPADTNLFECDSCDAELRMMRSP